MVTVSLRVSRSVAEPADGGEAEHDELPAPARAVARPARLGGTPRFRRPPAARSPGRHGVVGPVTVAIRVAVWIDRGLVSACVWMRCDGLLAAVQECAEGWMRSMSGSPADARQGSAPAHRGGPDGPPGSSGSGAPTGRRPSSGTPARWSPLLGRRRSGWGAAQPVAGLVGGRDSTSAPWCRTTFRNVTTTSSQQ